MKNTGSNGWNKLQNKLSSTLLVDINIDGEDKQLPLSVIRNMAYDRNPEVRRKAYRKIEQGSSAALNGIKGEVITLCDMRGYKSPLEQTLIDSRIEAETLEAMLTAMRESLPTFRKFYLMKAKSLGHGYHGHWLMNESFLNCDYTMPIAETASIFCETIIKNAALKTASKEEAFAILEGDISGAGQLIVDMYIRFLFESELFNRRKNSSISVDEIKEIMMNSQKEAYGEGIDHNYLHPYMWANKPHYYFAEQNFYNFLYAFGLLFSKGLYAEYLKSGSVFVSEYDKLLSVTGKNKIEDVAAMNIDIERPKTSYNKYCRPPWPKNTLYKDTI